jgi:hypothetical protein
MWIKREFDEEIAASLTQPQANKDAAPASVGVY